MPAPLEDQDTLYSIDSPPSTSGLSSRQARIPNERQAQSTRKIMHWLIPEGPIVQMYINPQSVKITKKKGINYVRTKGGFIIQYWGEDLTKITLSGTTGTSGIEGINVLDDVYRNEQLAFDAYGLYLAQKQQQDTFAADLFGIGSSISNGSPGGFVDSLLGASEQAAPQASTQAPTLASLAATVELYWSGEVYRGFFEAFDYDEEVNKLGMFDYTLSFTATQKRGHRSNFLAWHRSATSGPSNSDPEFGTPHSFGTLLT